MKNSRFLKRMAVTAGLTVLIAATDVSRAQNPLIALTSTKVQGNAGTLPTGQSGAQFPSRQAPRMTQETSTPETAEKKLAQIQEYIMSLPLSDDQKTQISRINESMKSRMDLVVKDDKETADQKEAMVEGLQRMRLRQIFMVLTREQRMELRNKLATQPSAASGQGAIPKETPPK